MTKRIAIFTLCVLVLLQPFALEVFAKGESLEFYFYPLPMKEDGTVEIQINMRNIERAFPADLGSISAVGMDILVDTEAVDIVNVDDPFVLADGMLIADKSNLISVAVDSSTIRMVFIDMTLEKGLITRDGTLCSFRVKAKNKGSFYNSNDTYGLSFENLSATAFNTVSYNLTALDNVCGWANTFGGNMPAQWLPPLKKPYYDKMEFVIGEKSVMYGSEKVELDCAAYIDEATGEVMLPVRAFLDGAGYGVNWDDRRGLVMGGWAGKMFAAKPGEAQIALSGGDATLSANVVNRNGRTFMPLGFLADFTGYTHSLNSGRITLYIVD